MTPEPQTPAGIRPPDPQLMYSNAEEYQRQNDAYQQYRMQEALQQASQPLLSPLSNLARNSVKQNAKFADVFDRYGPEIEAMMQTVPLQARADERSWEMAAKVVMADHMDDLTQSRAERLAANPAPATISGMSGDKPPAASGPPTADPIDELFASDHPAVADYKRDNIKPSQVKKHAASMGMTTEQYAERLKTRSLIRSRPFHPTN